MGERHVSANQLLYLLYGHTNCEPVPLTTIAPEKEERSRPDWSQKDTPKTASRDPLQSLQRLVDETATDESTVLPYALSSFPEEFGLCKSGIPGAQYGVYAKVTLPMGTGIGPYEGKLIAGHVHERHHDDQLWEVFVGGKVALFMDAHDTSSGNWMRYIQPARHAKEQNLEVFQHQRTIYYRAVRDVSQGTELLVWYGGQYTLYMGIPLHQTNSSGAVASDDRYGATGRTIEPNRKEFNSGRSAVSSVESNSLDGGPTAPRFSQLEAWQCGQCFRSFSQRSLLQMHVCDTSANHPYLCGYCSRSFCVPDELKNHVAAHAAEKPFKCGFCHRAFAGATTLNNHMRTHTNTRPFRCNQCGKDFTQGIQYSRHLRHGECPESGQRDLSHQESAAEDQEEMSSSPTNDYKYDHEGVSPNS